MSFSSKVKNEIVLKDIDYTDKNIAMAELMAFVVYAGKLKKHIAGLSLKIKTENAKIARRIYKHLKNAVDIKSVISIHKVKEKSTVYEVKIDDTDNVIKLYIKLGLIKSGESIDKIGELVPSAFMLRKTEYRRSFAKGAFLCSGSVNDPNKNYHLEFALSTKSGAQFLDGVLKKLGFEAKIIKRKNKYVIYFKNSDIISDVISMLEAVTCFNDYCDAKILKNMKNNINRTMNCDNANMNKTIDASMYQAKCIQILMDNGIFDELDSSLKEIALLRLENKDVSLKTLGEMLEVPIGKSGVNHRLRKIQEIAERYM